MDKIFAVVELKFFISNGIDYAMAVDPATDMNLFYDKDKAIDFFDCYTEELCKMYDTDFEVIYDDDNAKVNLWRRPNDSRTFLKLIEMNIK